MRTNQHLTPSIQSFDYTSPVLNPLGADPNPLDRWGFTPFDDGVRGKHVHVTDMLRAVGGRSSSSALQVAFQKKQSQQSLYSLRPRDTRAAGPVLLDTHGRDIEASGSKQASRTRAKTTDVSALRRVSLEELRADLGHKTVSDMPTAAASASSNLDV